MRFPDRTRVPASLLVDLEFVGLGSVFGVYLAPVAVGHRSLGRGGKPRTFRRESFGRALREGSLWPRNLTVLRGKRVYISSLLAGHPTILMRVGFWTSPRRVPEGPELVGKFGRFLPSQFDP